MGSCRGLSPWLADGRLLTMSSRGRQKKSSDISSLLMSTLILYREDPSLVASFNRNDLQRHHLCLPSHGGLGLQLMGLVGAHAHQSTRMLWCLLNPCFRFLGLVS